MSASTSYIPERSWWPLTGPGNIPINTATIRLQATSQSDAADLQLLLAKLPALGSIR
jgi:hypothetical protein